MDPASKHQRFLQLPETIGALLDKRPTCRKQPPGLLNEIDTAAGLARFAGNERVTGTG
jgi:hypothetical protein